MKIAHLLPAPQPFHPPLLGSLGIEVHEVGRRMAGDYPFLVYAMPDPARDGPTDVDGLKIRRMPIGLSSKVVGLLRRVPWAFAAKRPLASSPWYYRGYMARVAKDARLQGCDIIQVHESSQFLPVLRSHSPNAKIVLRTHSEWLTDLDPAVVEPRLRAADLVLGCSRHLIDRTRHRFPWLDKRCRVLYSGVDVERFRPADEPGGGNRSGGRILFVGRISPEKGVHILVDAFKSVLERVPHAHLVLVGAKRQIPRDYIVAMTSDPRVAALDTFYDGTGDDSYFRAMQDKIAALGLADRVEFTGNLPYDQLVDHYRRADVVANPSLSESFGRSLIEAMACGVPVIASRVGGMPETVQDGVTGDLVEPDDAQDLARALVRRLTDSDSPRDVGIAGRAHVLEHFSWRHTAERLAAIYEGIV